MDSFIETFHIDWKIIIAQAINFFIILAVLYFFALKPLKKVMTERSKTIEGGLNDAKINKELLDKTQKEYDTILARAKIEAHDIFKEGKKEAEQNKAQIIEIAQKDVENMINKGKKVLESEKVKMVEEAKKEIVFLVVKATEKLLEQNPSESFDQKTLNNLKNL